MLFNFNVLITENGLQVEKDINLFETSGVELYDCSTISSIVAVVVVVLYCNVCKILSKNLNS